MPRDLDPVVIVIEGTDYSGKTTAVEALQGVLSEYKPTAVVGFPTNEGYGKQARTLWANNASAEDTAKAMVSDMLESSKSVPTKAEFVIFDRYLPSTVALQGDVALEIATEWGLGDSALAPDIYVVLSVPYVVAVRRARYRATEWDDHRTAPALESEATWAEYTKRCVDAAKTVAAKLPSAKRPKVIKLEYYEGMDITGVVRTAIADLGIQ